MDWQLLAPFLTATLLLMVTPDAVVAVVVHNTLRDGAVAGILTALGVELGEVFVLATVFTGLIISQEFLPLLFRWISFIGIAYLLWRATRTLRVRRPGPDDPVVKRSSRPIVDGLTIAFSNPTTLVFHTAFFPQFVNLNHPLLPQLLTLGAIYLGLSLVFDGIFVAAAERFRPFLRRGHSALGRLAKLGSALLYACIALVALIGLANASR